MEESEECSVPLSSFVQREPREVYPELELSEEERRSIIEAVAVAEIVLVAGAEVLVAGHGSSSGRHGSSSGRHGPTHPSPTHLSPICQRISLCLSQICFARYLRDTKDWRIKCCRPSKSFDNKLVKSELSEDQQ